MDKSEKKTSGNYKGFSKKDGSRSENVPLRVTKKDKLLLIEISKHRKERGYKLSSMNDILILALEMYADYEYSEIKESINQVYKDARF